MRLVGQAIGAWGGEERIVGLDVLPEVPGISSRTPSDSVREAHRGGPAGHASFEDPLVESRRGIRGKQRDNTGFGGKFVRRHDTVRTEDSTPHAEPG